MSIIKININGNNHGKDIALDDFVLDDEVGGIHIVIGNPKKPKHYHCPASSLQDFTESRSELIRILINHLTKLIT